MRPHTSCYQLSLPATSPSEDTDCPQLFLEEWMSCSSQPHSRDCDCLAQVGWKSSGTLCAWPWDTGSSVPCCGPPLGLVPGALFQSCHPVLFLLPISHWSCFLSWRSALEPRASPPWLPGATSLRCDNFPHCSAPWRGAHQTQLALRAPMSHSRGPADVDKQGARGDRSIRVPAIFLPALREHEPPPPEDPKGSEVRKQHGKRLPCPHLQLTLVKQSQGPTVPKLVERQETPVCPAIHQQHQSWHSDKKPTWSEQTAPPSSHQ